MDAEKKKALKEAYKNKTVVGGVYCIECKKTGKRWIKSTRDIESMTNRFNFATVTKSCPEPEMRKDWEEYGTSEFSFGVLEKIEKKEDRTDKEFADYVDTLLEMWLEKEGITHGAENKA